MDPREIELRASKIYAAAARATCLEDLRSRACSAYSDIVSGCFLRDVVIKNEIHRGKESVLGVTAAPLSPCQMAKRLSRSENNSLSDSKFCSQLARPNSHRVSCLKMKFKYASKKDTSGSTLVAVW